MSRIFFLLVLYASFLFFVSCATPRYERGLSADYTGKQYAVASWYGQDFHGRPTSSGEIFNMHAFTCAHKEFPFGTTVRVTNVRNNRSAECIVNDRGPFVEGRDIDLSYALAKEIGLIGTGTGRVLLEVQGRDESYVRRVKVQAKEKQGPFAIQAGSFSDSINAIRLKKALSLKFNNVYIQEAEVKGETYYRVRIGDFGQLDKAVSVAEELGREGYPVLVMKADVRI